MTSAREIKVAQVIDRYKIIINKGSTSGIEKGDRFLIYEIGEEIMDPDTNESLGKLEIVKGTGRVTHVQEKMSTIVSDQYEYETVKSTPPPIVGIGKLFSETPERKIRKQIPFEDPEAGDLVKKVY